MRPLWCIGVLVLIPLMTNSKCSRFSCTPKTDTCKVTKLNDIEFNESGEKGYAVTCACSNLTSIPSKFPHPTDPSVIPPLRLLNLRYNGLKNLTRFAFMNKTNLNASALMWLMLDCNKINYIDGDSFYGLSSLVYFNLSYNFLVWPTGYTPNIFAPLISLYSLDLHGNYFNTFENLGLELGVMNSSLQRLRLSASENCTFDKEFESLTHLKSVGILNPDHCINVCNITIIKSDVFTHIPQVQELTISSCGVRTIDVDALTPLINLTLLDLSYNEELHFEGMNDALAGLRFSTTLERLNVNHIYPIYEAGITLQPRHLENLKTLKNLKILNMDMNKLEVMNCSVLEENYFPESLRHITMTGNRLSLGKYIEHLKNFTSVQSIDISRQHLNYDPFYWQHFETDQSYKRVDVSKVPSFCFWVPPNVVNFTWSQSFLNMRIEEVDVCGTENLRYLDLSSNLIISLQGPMTGFENLEHLDLSDNSCQNISSKFFSRFHSLKFLNISNNDFENLFAPNYNKYAAMILKYLQNLTTLDMSYDKIKQLDQKTFSGLIKLNKLLLNDNMLHEWTADLTNSKSLTYLNLSGNKISVLNASVRNYLDTLTMAKCNKNKTVMVDLSNNALLCSCKQLSFWEWVARTKVVVHYDECNLDGNRIILNTIDDVKCLLNKLKNEICVEKTWKTYVIAGGSSLAAVLLTSFAYYTYYKNRWKLRYLYYSRNKRFHHTGFEHIFAQDAMISYAKSKSLFVKNDLLPALEQKSLTLWIADRHARAGASLAENIVHAIYTSRKIVLLVDREYLRDSWCDYEMNMALVESVETQRKCIIVVLMNCLQMKEMPLFFLRLLRSEKSLEYPERTQDIDMFWTTLAEEIES